MTNANQATEQQEDEDAEMWGQVELATERKQVPLEVGHGAEEGDQLARTGAGEESGAAATIFTASLEALSMSCTTDFTRLTR